MKRDSISEEGNMETSGSSASPVVSGCSGLQFEISQLWNGETLPQTTDRINTQINFQGIGNMLTLSIISSFFDDPAPPTIKNEEKSYINLWSYELLELIFYSTESTKSLEILLCPHGHYLVLLSNGTKNYIANNLRIEFSAEIERSEKTWKGFAKIPLGYLPTKVDRFMAVSLHGRDSQRQYETLYPIPGENPDLYQPEHFGKFDLNILFLELPTTDELSTVWKKALQTPLFAKTIYFMWDGTPIEQDHDHKGKFCTLFFNGVDEGLQIQVLSPFFDDPPPEGVPGPKDLLWEHEVAEVFFLAAYPSETNRYTEIELGPHGHHIVLLLDGVRQAVAKLLPIQYEATIDRITNSWIGSAIIPKEYFPPAVSKFMVTAVHNTGKKPEDVKYEVLSPMPGPAADFHRVENYLEIDFEQIIPGNQVSTMSQIWADAIENPVG